jgi:archaemetzincin
MEIVLQPIGVPDRDIIDELSIRLVQSFGCPVKVLNPIGGIEQALDESRNQYKASVFMNTLNHKTASPDHKLLGVADVDIYDQGLDYIFGEADKLSGAALISLYRLRQEYYGLLPERDLFLDRVAKEAIHELGHTFGLKHCIDIKCVMHLSDCLADTDWKTMDFCSQCRPKLLR